MALSDLAGRIKDFFGNKEKIKKGDVFKGGSNIPSPPKLKIEKVDPRKVKRLLKKYDVKIHTEKTPQEILSFREKRGDIRQLANDIENSKLYRDVEDKTGFNYREKLSKEGFQGLKETPLISWEDIFPYYQSGSRLESLLNSKGKDATWITTTGRTRHKHYPWGGKGEELLGKTGVNLAIKAGIKPGDKVLKAPAPAPFATKFIMDTITNNMPLELYDLNIETIPVQLDLIKERGFDVGASAPNMWGRIAEEFSRKAPQESKLAKVASLVKKIRPKDKEEFSPRLLIGGGTAISNSMEESLHEDYDTFYVDVLAATEQGITASGCYADVLNKEVFYEGPAAFGILPRKYINDKGEVDSNYEIKFPHEAEEGTVGEVIIYNFNPKLPFIGVRSGDLLKVTKNGGECDCGSLAPKVSFVGRLGHDPVDVNGAKIWKNQFRESLDKIEGIKYWQVRVDRDEEANKTTLDILLEPYPGVGSSAKNKVRKIIENDPGMSEFRKQRNAYFSEDDEVEPLKIRTVEGELSEIVEKRMTEDNVYKVPEFHFTEGYLKRVK